MIRVSIVTPCFRSEPYLEGYFKALLAQTVLDQVEAVLVLNEPSAQECAIVARFEETHPGVVCHLVIPEGWNTDDAPKRGTRSLAYVSQSMNRGVAAARGEFIAHWDHDDIRTPDSIEAELRTLTDNPEALMTYGDMIVIRRYGDTEGELIVAPEFSRGLFMRGCPGGTFRMWRKSAAEIAGPFDEQLKSGADFDLYVRLAANGRMVRTPQVLGYYLNAGIGLSSAGDGVQPVERTVVELRYGILDKIDRRYLAAASRYRIGELLVGDEWVPVGRFVPDLEGLLARAAADPRLEQPLSARDRVVGVLRRTVRRLRSVTRP